MDIFLHKPREYYGDMGKLIGKGQYGRVYELPNNLCIKIDASLDEMSVFMKIHKCKYIVCMIDMGVYNGDSYIIMERALSDLNFVSIENHIYVLYQIVMGCIYLSTYGIRHTDHSARNVLYYGKDKIKLTDIQFFESIPCNMDTYEFTTLLYGIGCLRIPLRLQNLSLIELACDPILKPYRKRDYTVEELSKHISDKCVINKNANLLLPRNYLLDDKRTFDMIDIIKTEKNTEKIFRILTIYDYIIGEKPDISRIGLIKSIADNCKNYTIDPLLTSILNFNWYPTTPYNYITEDVNTKLLIVLYIENPTNWDEIINKSKFFHRIILSQMIDELRSAYDEF